MGTATAEKRMHLPRCWCADRRCRLPRVHRFAAAHASGCHPEAGPAGTLERTETAPPSAILAKCCLPNQTSSPPCQYHRLLLSHLLTSITNTTCNMSTHNPNSPKNDQQDSAKLRPVTKASFPYQLVMTLQGFGRRSFLHVVLLLLRPTQNACVHLELAPSKYELEGNRRN